MTTTKRERERKYGLMEGQYDWLMERNDHRCWGCDQPETIPNRSLAVDHCHETGQVRGALCTRCNQVLGRVKDSPPLLRRLADYLEASRAVFSDCCDECFEPRPPAYVIETDSSGTRFAYRCEPCGVSWDCSWATRGAPWAWFA